MTMIERVAIGVLTERHGARFAEAAKANDWQEWAAAVEDAGSALEAITQAGYVIVPREPTEAMTLAGAGVWLGGTVHGMSDEWHERMRLTFDAMISSALSETSGVKG